MKLYIIKNLLRNTLLSIIISVAITDQCISSDFIVEKITAESLSIQKKLFMKFHEVFSGLSVQNDSALQVVDEVFAQEEEAYVSISSKSMFFHALLDDQVIGYISCDVADNHNISIRQLLVDPEMFDVTLIKELLFAIFLAMPQVKNLMIYCPVGCTEMHALLLELGFGLIDTKVMNNMISYEVYQIAIQPKCKICDVLYGEEFWEAQMANNQWGQYDADLEDGYLEDGHDNYSTNA